MDDEKKQPDPHLTKGQSDAPSHSDGAQPRPPQSTADAARAYLDGDLLHLMDKRGTNSAVIESAGAESQADLPDDLVHEVQLQQSIDDSLSRLLGVSDAGLTALSHSVQSAIRQHMESAHTDGDVESERDSDRFVLPDVGAAAAAALGAPLVVGRMHGLTESESQPAGPQTAFQRFRENLSFRRIAIAAVLLMGFAGLCKTGVYIYDQNRQAVVPNDPAFAHDVRFEYMSLLQKGFKPEHPFSADNAGQAVASAINEHFGASIAFDLSGAKDIRMAGFSGSSILSSKTLVIQAIVRDETVFMFVDTANHNVTQADVCHFPVQRFERDLGGLVVYEVTPYSTPSLLNRLSVVDSR